MIENGDEHLPLLNRLKEYRSRLGVNQTEMGKLAGVSRQTISQIERGDYSPSVTLALKIAKICEVRVEDIFIYEEEINDEGKEKELFYRNVEDARGSDNRGNRRRRVGSHL